MIKHIYKIFALSVSAIVLLLVLFFAFMQTSWVREHFTAYLMQVAKENHINLKIEQTKGLLPSEYSFRNVEITVSPDTVVKINTLKINISLLQLLFKEIAFTTFDAKDIYFIKTSSSPKEQPTPSTQKKINLPYGLFFKSFHLKKIHIPDFSNVILSLSGKAKIDKKLQGIYLNTQLEREDFSRSRCHIFCQGSRKNNILHSKITLETPSQDVFREFFSLPVDMDFSVKILAKTQFVTFLQNLSSQKPLKIKGKVSGHIHNMAINHNPIINKALAKNWKIFSLFTLSSLQDIHLHNLVCENDFITVKGSTSITNSAIEKMDIIAHGRNLEKVVPHFSSKLLQAKIQGHRENDVIHFSANMEGKNIITPHLSITDASWNITANYQNQQWDGQTQAKMNIEKKNCTLDSNFSYQNQLIRFTNFIVTTPDGEIEGNIDINKRKNVIGIINTHLNNLSLLNYFYPQIDINGKINLACTFSETSQETQSRQLLHVAGNVYSFHLQNLFAKEASLLIDIYDVFTNPKGSLLFSALQSSYFQWNFDNFIIKTSNFSSKNPFEIIAHGKIKDPFALSSKGYWSYENKILMVDISELLGNIFTHHYQLLHPLQLTYAKDLISCDNIQLEIAKELLEGKVIVKDNFTDIYFHCDKLPLDFLSLNTLQLTTRGFGKFNAMLSYKNKILKSDLSLDIDKLTAYPSSKKEKPFHLMGNVKGHIENHILKLTTLLQYKEKQKLQLQANIPVHLTFSPFAFALNTKLPLSATCNFNGRMEEIIDFFDLGSHKIEGNVICDLEATGTLTTPYIHGNITIKDGIYENYFTGTYLKDITGTITANHDNLLINKLEGKGLKKGHFTSSGQATLNLAQKFPYALDVQFQDLTWVQTDLITTTAKGEMLLQGNMQHANASGKITITSGELIIPEKLPQSIPHLPVTYIPPTKDTTDFSFEKRKTYPIYMNVDIFVPDNFLVTGRGVNSEWKGEMHLKGAYDQMLTRGDMQLLKGTFNFSGYSFDLIQGDLSFSGKQPHEMPHLRIAGKTTIQGNTITVALDGPINQPNLQLTSSPPLPLSSILSLMLFGQDISELSGMQAIQLATSVASLSGGGPDLLETTRKKLGIDRLAIVSTPTTNIDDPNTSSIQFGKYVMKGVMVSFSQGLDQDSSNVIVEVDLSHGFIFQAETQQEEEQGKFTLKWNYTY